MNIDRYMVNLFFEIKRNTPIHQQAGMKISNPNIGNVMSDLYQETNDENIKLLTRIFLERAGDSWLKDTDKKSSRAATLIKKLANANSTSKQNPAGVKPAQPIKAKAKRIYRGQVVED